MRVRLTTKNLRRIVSECEWCSDTYLVVSCSGTKCAFFDVECETRQASSVDGSHTEDLMRFGVNGIIGETIGRRFNALLNIRFGCG